MLSLVRNRLSLYFNSIQVYYSNLGAYEYLTKKKHGTNIDVSRLFIYYNARVKENGGDQHLTDSGTTLTSAIEALEELGTCLESLWPYDISKCNTRPSNEAYKQAKLHPITDALQIKINLNEMKSCLAQGFPFAFGLTLFSSFGRAASSGVVPMPTRSERSQTPVGGSVLSD
jgi:C1A family cysteine protease